MVSSLTTQIIYTTNCCGEHVNSRKTPVSKYNIVTNTPGIRQQRADRVNHMMDSLEKNGYIVSEYTSSNITFYKITQKGIDD